MGKKQQQPLSPDELIKSGLAWAPEFLKEFLASDKNAHTFDNSLTNSDRATIHSICQQMGLRSRSAGSGKNRCLTVSKRSNKKRKGNLETSDSAKSSERTNEKPDGNLETSERAERLEGRIRRKNGKGNGQENLKCVSFPPEAKPVLQELFTRYPPCEGDTTGTSLAVYTGKRDSQRKWRDDFFARPQFNKNYFEQKVASLSKRMTNDKGFQEILKARTKLPIASFKDAITSAVESNQVVLIAGETGCGKTTQVPQYLLDHMWYSKQESCKIICTQPRRISAISVSERLAWERGETIGNSVGYKVRLQSEGGRQTSVVFCTNGILLRVLVGKGSGSCVPDITHIIVDEIHERDCYSDFMLAIIREFLPSNPHLRLILMSATLDAERFSGYFGGCPVVRVPGFTYPVRTFYLEDVLSFLNSDKNNHLSVGSNLPDGKHDISGEDKAALDEAIDLAWTDNEFDTLVDLVSSEGSHEVYNYRQSSTWLTPLMVFAGKGMVSEVCKLLARGADCKLKSKEGVTALELAEKENQVEAALIIREHLHNIQANSQQAQDLLDKYLATINAEEVDVVLIARLMRKLCSDSEVGAILVFLPGWDEISKTRDKLLATPYFADSAKFQILCLHSRVPAEEQKRVFKRPPQGCRKIVLATNIAESAVTIDDVVYVIDSGRMKEKSYDPYSDVSTLQSSWVSKANAKQRAGRAGRCQPGICYHLYSNLRAASLPEYRVPEVRRMPVDELCLQVKMLDPSCNVNDFLQKLMDPPVDQSIANALTTLKDIGALTPQEELTELGQKFGQIPVHPRISKMLYFAILVNCLDPALILACAVDTKDPFTMPFGLGERKKAADAKRKLASLYGGHSDHLAIVAAFQCWKNAKSSGHSAEFCSQYYVSPNAMKVLDNMRNRLHGELKRHRLIPSNGSECSLNAHDPGIVRAVLAVGLYPMVGRMCPRSKYNRRSLVETITGAKVRVISNNFLMSSSEKDNEALIVFDEITRGDWDVHIRSCTSLPAIPLLLFSGEIAVAPIGSRDAYTSDDEEAENAEDAMDTDEAGGRPGEKIMLAPENSVKVVVDRWLPFKITAFEIAQLYVLRERLIASILFKVKHPKENLPPHLGATMYAITCVLSHDGLSNTSVQTATVEPVASVVDTTGLRDNMPSSEPNGSKENDQNTTPTGAVDPVASVVDTTGLRDDMASTKSHGSQESDQNTTPTAAGEPVASMVDTMGLRDTMPSTKPNGFQENDQNTAPIGSKPESANTPGVGTMEESLSDPNSGPTEAAASVVQKQKKKKPRSKKSKSVNNEDLGNVEENKRSDLANEKEQSDPSITLMEAGSAVKPNGTQGNDYNITLTAAVEPVASVADTVCLRDDMPSAKPNGSRENDQNTTPIGSNPESANTPDLGNMEESLSFNLSNGNEQANPNTGLMEAAASVVQKQKKKRKHKRCKSVNNEDLGNMQENRLDLANEKEDPSTVLTEAGSAVMPNGSQENDQNTTPAAAAEPFASVVDTTGLRDDMPSTTPNGSQENDQNTTPTAALDPVASVVDTMGLRDDMPSTKYNGNQENDRNTTHIVSKIESANTLGVGNMEESLSFNLSNGNEQADPSTGPTDAAASTVQKKKRKRSKSKICESVNIEDLGNLEGNKPSELADANEQSNPNTAPTEAGSAAEQPKKKRSKSKKRKLAEKSDSGNMEESLPSNLSNGNEQPYINNTPTEAEKS